MSTRLIHSGTSQFAAAEKTLNAALRSWTHPAEPKARKTRTFVTVSRQPGAGAVSFSHQLAKRLNEEGQGDWSAWDRELVEKVSDEHHIAKEVIEKIPDRHRNWLDELVQGFSVSQCPSDVAELRAYKRVVLTIRALATAGHAIIVGQGGTFVTEQMPGAIHLRLVAPLEHRIKSTAARDMIPLHEAAARIIEIDRRRSDFYRRFWPGKEIVPEAFTAMLNSAELSLDELVECVLPLIRSREATGDGSRDEMTLQVTDGAARSLAALGQT